MDMLQTRFETVLHAVHFSGTLPGVLADRAPLALRFQLGGEEPVYLGDHRKPNGAYIENAVDRALALYAALPGTPDLLRIDRTGEPGEPMPSLRPLHLPAPDQTVPLPPLPDGSPRESLYWCLSPNPDFLRPLFREIVRAELSAQGLEWLCGSVYFADTARDLLFQPYDDRGADLLAPEKSLLLPLYRTHRDWLLPKFLPRMDALFAPLI